MIRLVANASDSLHALVRSGQVDIDAVKVGPFLGMDGVRAFMADFHDCGFLLHCANVLAGSEARFQQTLDEVLEFVRLTDTPWVSAHLSYLTDEQAHRLYRQGIVPPAMSGDEAMSLFYDRAARLQAVLAVPLILENVPRSPAPGPDPISEAGFIAEVLAETEAGLLLDTAHARVTASAQGIAVSDYLSRLPLDRLVEVHVSGPRWENGVLCDRHDALTEEDYDVLAFVLARSSPRAVTLEYWKEQGEQARILRRLRAMLQQEVRP